MHKLKNLNPLLGFVNDLIELFAEESIKVPNDFHTQVNEIQNILMSDTSGLINSILDFGVNCALVDYKVETSNDNLTKLLNDWLININADLRRKIPVGIKPLAKQYFRERWKNSSLCILRTIWEEKNGLMLPTKLWFVDGGDIYINNTDETAKIGSETYDLRVGIKTKKKIKIPTSDNELLFIQKPFSSWGEDYPTPFIIQRGLFRNSKFLTLLTSKGEKIVGKALEYLMTLKKGNERLALSGKPEFIYSDDDMRKIKHDFAKFLEKRKTEAGTSSYVTGFDTEIEHLIPEYSRALTQELYAPVERRILAGLGFVEVIEGISTSRRDAILNPKPFVREIKQGIDDFIALLVDIMETIKEKNISHKKYTGNIIKIVNSPIQEFLTNDAKELLRNVYDRGGLSQRTFIEVVGNMDYDLEVKRRRDELANGEEIIMYPHPIMNREADISPEEELRFKQTDEQVDEDEIPEDKKGPEKVNYVQNNLTREEEAELFEIAKKILEQAPYNKIEDLPASVRNALTPTLQRTFMRVFNDALSRYKDETRAFKIAWSVIKKIAKKGKSGKWKRITKANLEKANLNKSIKELLDLTQLEIRDKQSKLLSNLLKQGEDNEDL
jgi:cation transport regulator ChaB